MQRYDVEKLSISHSPCVKRRNSHHHRIRTMNSPRLIGFATPPFVRRHDLLPLPNVDESVRGDYCLVEVIPEIVFMQAAKET